jgi:hypothetical protein
MTVLQPLMPTRHLGQNRFLLWAVCLLTAVSFCLTLRNSLTEHTYIIPASENKNPHRKGGENHFFSQSKSDYFRNFFKKNV